MKQTRRAARRRKVMRQRMIIGGSALALVILAFVIWILVLKGRVDQVPKDVIWNNIYIDDIDVSGMKADEAKAAIEARLTELAATTVILDVEEVHEEVTLDALGFCMRDVEQLVQDAVAYGKEGTVFKRHKLLKALKREKQVFPVVYAVHEEEIAKTIEKRIPHLENEAKDATITREYGEFVIQDEEKGLMVDVSASTKVIVEYFNTQWKKDGGTIALVTKEGEPKVTRADLETIEDLLGSFTTYCGVGGGRVQNIVTGVQHINGAVLMPGEEYSANAAMEPYTEENGYAEAGSYENGAVVQSMGGGICQVSSTLYNAVLLSELEIVERYAHSMLVGYVKPSMDAAIAGDYKDLVFKNNQDTPVYIEGYVSDGNVYFNIFGQEKRATDRSVEYESEVLEETPAKKKFVASQDEIGTLELDTAGHDGMKAKLWKVVYENGKEVSRKVMNNSSYRMSEATYRVGVATDHAEAKALVKNAISSQNEAKIKAAISEAQKLIDEAKKADKKDDKKDTPQDETPDADKPKDEESEDENSSEETTE